MKKIISILVCLVISSPFAALASNEWFMINTPVANFTTKDTEMFKHAVNQALDQNRDGKKLEWSNPKSGSHGYVVPYHTTHSKGIRCRELKIYNEADTVTGESKFQFCHLNGKWVVAE
jgi:surface antigen